jgi:hypothetical protein
MYPIVQYIYNPILKLYSCKTYPFCITHTFHIVIVQNLFKCNRKVFHSRDQTENSIKVVTWYCGMQQHAWCFQNVFKHFCLSRLHIPIFLTFWVILSKMHNIHLIIYPTQFVWGSLSYYSVSHQHTGRKWSGSSKSVMQLWCKGPQRNERRARWGKHKICDLDLHWQSMVLYNRAKGTTFSQ